jgi:hypothetical protein
MGEACSAHKGRRNPYKILGEEDNLINLGEYGIIDLGWILKKLGVRLWIHEDLVNTILNIWNS